MNVENFLETVCQEIKYKPIRANISEELQQHIQEIKDEYIQEGMEEKEAEERAVKQMGEPEKIGKELNKIHRPQIDWKLIILITILTTFGIAISILKQNTINEYEINKMLMYVAVGIVVSISIYFTDYRKIKKYSNIIYIIASSILILAISGIGDTINGVPVLNFIGTISLMPCIIAIPMYVIAFTGFLIDYKKESQINIKLNDKTITIEKDLLKILTLSIISLILIIKIPSKTNAIILGITYLIITTIYVSKKQENIKLICRILSIFIISTILITMLSKPYIIDRFKSNLNPELDEECWGYEGMLQKEIIENARLIGEADTEIISNDNLIINDRSNNAFIYLLGKTGILISSILIITIILTSIRLIKNAKSIKDIYGKYLIIGLSSLYIIQSVANILMNINLGIKTDINLPFVSYGGQYFVINLVSIAIILSIYRRKNIILEN